MKTFTVTVVLSDEQHHELERVVMRNYNARSALIFLENAVKNELNDCIGEYRSVIATDITDIPHTGGKEL